MYTLLETSKESLFKKYLRIFFVVAAYWIISITTVFVNKELFSGTKVKLNATLFVTWFQCVVSTFICVSATFMSQKFPRAFRINLPEAKPFHWETIKRVIPLSILFTMMISSNNLCLKFVSVAFYYVGRSLTTIFNVILTYIFLRERQSAKSIVCCLVIIAGFLLGVDQESLTETFSLVGTIFGIIGSFSLSMYSIYTKKTLPHVNGEVWLLSYYNNLYSCFLFLPLILINGEFNTVLNYEYIGKLWFWCAMLIGGFCGFLIGYVTTLQIKVTSPLTHNISGTAKACAQTVMATSWYHEVKSFLWWTSNLVVLLGSFSYARVKQLEMAKKHRVEQNTQKL
ncbi:CLUMA_CG005934, isoform A [Clunio marinus]|uniref:CLUMA_CG005934, isoform A n=1 Tax=Clunio marinus TaxID=568069 RepID=A0A1J1HXS6_9DIPT|nr:CLUMA_CG005934, isoform A [Clunio marinus]